MSDKTVIEKTKDVHNWARDNYEAQKGEQKGYIYHDIMKHAEAILDHMKHLEFYCQRCDQTVRPTGDGVCPNCGSKLPYYRAVGV